MTLPCGPAQPRRQAADRDNGISLFFIAHFLQIDMHFPVSGRRRHKIVAA